MASNKHFSKPGSYRMRQAVAVSLIALASAACSTDVTRFAGISEALTGTKNESTASIPDTARVEAAPLERVETSPLAPPPVAAAYGLSKRVTIEQGDTLYSISRQHNISIDEIAASNHLSKPYSVRVGQSLIIPAPGVPETAWNKPDYKARTSSRRVTSIAKNAKSPAPRNPVFSKRRVAASSIHTVRSGETLYGISRGVGMKPADIMRYNNIAPGQVLKSGQRLRIPPSSGAAAVAPRAVAMAKPAAKRSVPLPRRAPSVSRTKVAKTVTVKRKQLTMAKVATPKAAPRVKPRVKKPVKITKLRNPPKRSYGKFRWPVKGRVISEYGRKSNGARNDGINFSVPMGASVKAAENGVVAYAGNELKGYGNLVLIRHSGDWVTAYAHNSRLIVRQGQKVRRGDIIAKAGQTGSVTRPQLHFEVRKGAQAVNPRKYMAGSA